MPALEYSLVIVGSGPAGLSAAFRAQELGISYIVLEQNLFANTIHNYQKRKFVMDEPLATPVRGSFPIFAGSREEVLAKWSELAEQRGINFYQATVTGIIPARDGFVVYGHNDFVVEADKVVLATGVQGFPHMLSVPGATLPHVDYTLSDPDDFRSMNIIVLGAGDNAIENALGLMDKNTVTVVNRSADLARANDTNAALLQRAIDSGSVQYYSETTVSCIEESAAKIKSPAGEMSIPCDKVIARFGYSVPQHFLEKCGVTFSNDEFAPLPNINHKYETNVPGLYVIGAVTGYPLIKHAINQGYEVIEHIAGHEVEPADQAIIEQKLGCFDLPANQMLSLMKVTVPMLQMMAPHQLRELLAESTIHRKAEGDEIYCCNNYTDSFFSIISGEVIVELPGGNFQQLRGGQFFGEMGMEAGRRRAETVRAASDVFLLETPRKQILKLARSVAEIRKILDKTHAVRALQNSVFPEVSIPLLKSIVGASELMRFATGDVVIDNGINEDYVFVVIKGSIRVSAPGASIESRAESFIDAPSFVSRMSYCNTSPDVVVAQAIAVTACETIAIPRTKFFRVVEANPSVKERIRREGMLREVEGIIGSVGAAQSSVLDLLYAEGLADAENVLIIDAERCIHCDNCERACAATHGGFSRLDRGAGAFYASVHIPISCRHCNNAQCMDDCPPNAIIRQADGEVVIKDSCIGCGNCVQNCPYDVISMVEVVPEKRFSLLSFFREKKETVSASKAAKCDMCAGLKGGAACVRSCPTGAAMRVRPSELVQIIQNRGGKLS